MQGDGAVAGAVNAEEGTHQRNYVVNIKNRQTNSVICTNGAGHDSGDVTPTLQANLGKLLSNQTPIVCYENHAQDSRIKDAGEVSPQLNAKAGTGGNNLPLVQTFTKTAHPQNPEQGQGFAETETAKTLSVHTSPASEIRAEELVAVAIAENIIGRKPQNGGNGTGAQEELAYTQNATGVMGVWTNTKGNMKNDDADKTNPAEILRELRAKIGEKAFRKWAIGRLERFQAQKVLQSDVHGASIQCEAEKGKPRMDDGALSRAEDRVEKLLFDLWEHFKLGHPSQGLELAEQFAGELDLCLSQLPHENPPRNATVRRLLPIETERLMGFPDNWTRIRWKGKSEEDCPDSPRYKACGNSMCVNVMRWIGMRIDRVGKLEDK